MQRTGSLPSSPVSVAALRGAAASGPRAAGIAGVGATRLKMAFAAAAHIGLLQFAYSRFISPALEYQGFLWRPVSIGALLGASLFAIVPTLWLPLRFTRPSQVVHYLIYICVYIPGCTIPLVAQELSLAETFRLNVALLICMFVMGAWLRRPLVALPKHALSPANYTLVLYGAAYGGCALLIWNFGLDLKFHSFASVYEVRFDMREAFAGYQRFYGYLWPWEAHVILPAIFVLGWQGKKWAVCGSAVLLEAYIYCVTGMKGVLFYLPVVFLLISSLKFFRISLANLMMLGPPLTVGTLMAVDGLMQTDVLTILLVRRQFVTPGWMLGVWYEFFIDAPKAWLSHSVLRGFVEAPYDMSPGRIVGVEQLHSPEMNACANFWADGYGNFGMGGVFLATFFVAGTLYAFDCLMRRTNIYFAAAILIVPGLALIDSGILTAVVTHGLGVAMILALLSPDQPPDRRARAPAQSTQPTSPRMPYGQMRPSHVRP